MQCSAAQCSVVQCIALQCSAMQCCAVQWSAVQCSAVQCSTGQYSAMKCSEVHCRAIKYSSVQCSAVQCSAVQWRLDTFAFTLWLYCVPHCDTISKAARIKVLQWSHYCTAPSLTVFYFTVTALHCNLEVAPWPDVWLRYRVVIAPFHPGTVHTAGQGRAVKYSVVQWSTV